MTAHCWNPPYDIYCKWCISVRREPPTREWWDNSCSQPRQPDRRLSDDEWDDAEEQRDGWAL